MIAACEQLLRYVADVDGGSGPDHGSRELVLGVLATVLDLGMELLDTATPDRPCRAWLQLRR